MHPASHSFSSDSPIALGWRYADCLSNAQIGGQCNQYYIQVASCK